MSLTSKANEMRALGEDIIVLTVGEPDFDTPQYIKDAGQEAIESGKTKYTSVDGVAELKDAIVNKFKKENNLIFNSDEVIVSAGCKQSIFNLLQVIIDTDDEVLIPEPYWVSYADMVVYAGGKPILIESSYENNFDLNFYLIEKNINNKTKLFMLNSPNNPSGKYFNSTMLKKLAELLRKYDKIYISSDDIYEHIFWHQEKFQNILNVAPDLKDRTIIFNGVSKAYSMTGWRIGYAAGNKEIIKKMKTLQSQSTSCASSVSQYAAISALTQKCEELPKMNAEYKERHDYVVKELNNIPGVTCKETDGTFYVFPSFTKYIEESQKINNDDELAMYLLNEGKVAVVPGSAFGMSGHLRLSIALDLKSLEIAMNRIKKTLNNDE
jgi:aspartate aminotransferase